MACEDQSAACKQDRSDYDSAATERADVEQRIYRWGSELQKANADVVASGGLAVSGVAVAWGAGWTGVGLVLGGVMFVGGALSCGWSYSRQSNAKTNLADERAACEQCRQKMENARNKALTDCQNPDCVPSMVQPCP